jgi:signal transduction histidine kinase
MVAAMMTSGDLLTRLISDILDLSKLRAGKMTVEIRDVEIQPLLDALCPAFRLEAAAKGLHFRYAVEPAGLMVRADGVRLTQILNNLLGNAIKFTQEGFVTLQVRPAGEQRVSFIVQDTGVGIPPEDQSRIFEEFVQAESGTTRRFGGSGLGLAISAKLAELMNGHITVSSEPGKGASFTLTLPAAISESRS